MKKILAIAALLALTACATDTKNLQVSQSADMASAKSSITGFSDGAAASDSNINFARNYLRCAAFYVFGLGSVNRPELKQELRDLADKSLYSAEVLMNGNRPAVKEEFNAARENFFAEISSDEVKADPTGFLNYMGEYCVALRENRLPKS